MRTKQALRKEILAELTALPASVRAEASTRIVQSLESHPAFQQARIVLAFQAMRGEPNLAALVAAHPEKVWGFPRIESADQLRFFTLSDAVPLQPGAFGILEPAPGSGKEIAPHEVDLVLVPGVSFDPVSGARMGRGKGYYDRFLSEVRRASPSSVLLGIGFAMQWRPTPTEAHDVPMDHLVSEEGSQPIGSALTSS